MIYVLYVVDNFYAMDLNNNHLGIYAKKPSAYVVRAAFVMEKIINENKYKGGEFSWRSRKF